MLNQHTYFFASPFAKIKKKVEKEAAAKQIKRIILNTYSFQAPAFYKKMSYKQLFKIAPAFKDYDQYYGSLSNLTDACQGVLYDFDKGTKQNLSVWCLF